jgi:hypothetical protein
MYLRQVGGRPLVQGVVRTEWPAGTEAAGRIATWTRLFLASVSLWNQFQPRSVAVRLTYDPGRPLTSVHAFVADAAEADRLRLVLAAFLRTDQIATGHTEAPLSAEDLQAGELHNVARVGIAPERLSTSDGNTIHYNVRLSELIGRVFEAASGLGLPCSFEMQAAGWQVPREILRPVLYAAAHLQDSAAAPADLVRDQMQLGDRLKRAQWHMEECLASPAGLEPLRRTLGHILESTIYARLGAPPAVETIDQERARCFALLVHPSQLLPAWTPAENRGIAGADSREAVEKALACQAAGVGNALVHTGGAGSPAAPVLTAHSAPPPNPTSAPMSTYIGAPFLFVSYARMDSERVYPVVEDLRRKGISVWIDRQLQTGDEWLDELEQRLCQCSGVLAFVSPAFAASRYCGREVRYADALPRQMFPVYLEPTPLTGALKFILQPVQGTNVYDEGASDRLIEAIRRHAPAAVYSA